MRKKILVINKFCPLHPRAGGAEKNLLEIFSRIGEKHEVHLLTALFPGAAKEESYQHIRIHRIGNPESENVIRIHFLLPILLKRYLKIIQPDILVEDVSVLPLFTPLLYPHQKKIIIIHNLNRFQFFKSQRFFYALIGYAAETLFLLLYRWEKVMEVSEWMKNELLRHKFRKVHKVLNGVNENLFFVKKEYTKYPTVLFLGRLENRKGIDLFLKTYPLVKNKIPRVKYLVAGREFGSRSKTEKLYGIEFLGYVSEKEKEDLFGRAWLYVAPSRIEGYGISVLEANATGTFVLANNVKGLRESVKDGETGKLVDCYNKEELAENIIKWLDKQKLKEREDDCKKWARKHNWDNAAKETEAYIF